VKADRLPDPDPGTADSGLVHVEMVMGTAVSFHLRPPLPGRDAIDAACAALHDIDRRFSLYRSDSELGRLARGEIEETALSPDVRWVLAACDDLERTSGGAFDARHHRTDGVVDPSGFVKGWAVEEAARHLDEAGALNYVIAAGGDVLARGESLPGRPWRVGIRHPDDPGSVVAVLAIRTGAVATSGLYERGEHIVDPRSGTVQRAVRSMSVIGSSLAWADAYATAAFVMGLSGLAWVHEHPGYGGLAITAESRTTWTPRVEALLVRDQVLLVRDETPGGGAPSISGTSQPVVVS
jgi:FAD:protein FMN transferase